MEKWQEQINNSQSLEELDRIRDELSQEIGSNERDLALLEAELDEVRKTYHQMCKKSGNLLGEIRDKKLLFEKIEAQRISIEENQRRQEEKQRRRERASWSNAQWLNEIAKLEKDGFPESDEEILQLMEAYSHITVSEEDVLNIMSLLSAHNTRRNLYAPFWIKKQGRSKVRRELVDDAFPSIMYEVKGRKYHIEFWTDERYYYLKMDFECGCEPYYADYDCSETCDEVSIQLTEEDGLVTLFDPDDNIIAVDRSGCSWNSILLFDFSVLNDCWRCYGPKCESAPMTMVFAPCYLQKYFAREHLQARWVLDDLIDDLNNLNDSVEEITGAQLEEVQVDADTVMLELNRSGRLFYITINIERILINVAGTTSAVSDDMLLSEFEDAWDVYGAIARFFDKYEQRM